MFDLETLRRHLLGILGLALLIAGIGLLIFKGAGEGQWSMIASICIRVGSTLCALWLAFPQLVDLSTSVPAWLLGAIAVGGVVVAARPKAILVVGPALAAIAVLQFIGWLFKPPPNPPGKKPKRTKRADD